MSNPGRQSTVDLLRRLVAFDTTSRNSNLALIGFVRDYLDGFGVAYRVSQNAAGDKANIHAMIGPRATGGLALSGHVDTVPVDGQSWSADPFTLRHQDGRLLARGACDMKGFVAACLAAVPDFQAMPLVRPLHLFISYDEEVGCNGAVRLIEDMAESGLRPSVCVVGEPSMMKPILAHKGKLNLRVTVKGRPGHSSEPAKGVNAVYAAARAIDWVRQESERLAAEGPFEEGFDPPYTTIHVGTVKGGSILNIIPEHAEFTMEWRLIPGDDPYAHLRRMQHWIAETIEPAMKAVDPACGFSYTVELEMPGMYLPANHDLATIVKQVASSNSAGKVAYGTEGGFYEEAGIATIICGPGDIAQAHQPDEWIAEEQLVLCDRFIRRMAERLLT
ncbi:MAG TPA: acetylornithine deacetylase [Rhodopila sp.]|uniref:acetylornithine deacetylase n=1 Tax=Rhodopila sp. TaxID=2480087 RepID=UPI002B5184D8|nr:acetylornithine deacetylase [Rhodopila sp.]HVY13826.1 acetylornithine deacetylase [Rhodopila sp.]